MRVLHIQLDNAMGGIESFLLNIYKRIDKKNIQFDFIEYGYENRTFDKDFLKYGARIFKISNRSKNPLKAYNELRKIIKNNKYDVVHIHKNSLCDISAIKLCTKLKVPTIIIHSHNSSRDNKLVRIIHKINLKFINLNNYTKFACSKKAGEWLFGNDCKDFTIVNNGIELNNFIYDKKIREEIRKKYNIEENYVIGNIGRLSQQKNPKFLLKVLSEVVKFNNKIKLLWVGDGELRKELENYIVELDIKENVILTGRVENPQDYYQAMDLFVMPSFYEGFPIAAIEAQASDLTCLLSENITCEANILDDMTFLPINNEKIWIETILDKSKNEKVRKNVFEEIKKKGFDIKNTVEFLEEYYIGKKKI